MLAKRANVAVQMPVFTANIMRRCKMCVVLVSPIQMGRGAFSEERLPRESTGGPRPEKQVRHGNCDQDIHSGSEGQR